jgi:putative ABC transport system substrate-binding protein
MLDPRRRHFLTLLGGAAAGWPFAASAQQSAFPVVGLLHGGSADDSVYRVAAFRAALAEAGYVEGQNLAIEYRWANGRNDRLPALASDLVGRQVAVIVTAGGTPVGLAAKAATATIPIIFLTGDDPVRVGLVAGFNRPGGNLTGVTFLATALEPKRLALLRELVPTAAVIAVLINPHFPDAEVYLRDVPAAARSVGQEIIVLKASSDQEIESAIAIAARQRIGGLLVTADPFFTNRRDQLVAIAARYSIPAIYFTREFALAGGMMSYGADFAVMYRQAADYVGRILKGAKVADLPVQQPIKFELVINLNTAKTLGLTVPDKLLALADEVIE